MNRFSQFQHSDLTADVLTGDWIGVTLEKDSGGTIFLLIDESSTTSTGTQRNIQLI